MSAGSTERRREKRLDVRLNVRLVMLGETGEALAEDTTTENVSRNGACFFSDLPLERGRYLQVIRPLYTKSLVAAVIARRTGPDARGRLHVQFINQEWNL